MASFRLYKTKKDPAAGHPCHLPQEAGKNNQQPDTKTDCHVNGAKITGL